MMQLQQLAKDKAFVLGLRVCISLTLGMLFTLIPAPLGSDGYQFPHASSVFITCALVSFFPSLDAASSLKKSVHRIGGTMIGSSLAIVLGFISLQIGHGTSGQAAFLGVVLTIIFFAFPYYLAKTKNFTYAAGLGFVTGGLIALSFYNASPDRPWLYACYRTAALLVGCCISLIVSLVILPKPIEDIVRCHMMYYNVYMPYLISSHLVLM